jgi:large conductance mechanosensitive channel
MSILKEFKEFAVRGNAIDLAVGIIIGAAFTAIVGSLVADLINPIISLFMGGVDFGGLFVNLGGDYATIAAADEAGGAVFAYGRFIMAIINFLIIAFVVFMLVKMVNRIKAQATSPDDVAPEVQTGPSELDVLLEIRDSLAANR